MGQAAANAKGMCQPLQDGCSIGCGLCSKTPEGGRLVYQDQESFDARPPADGGPGTPAPLFPDNSFGVPAPVLTPPRAKSSARFRANAVAVGIDEDLILSDLENAEVAAYVGAFTSFAGSAAGTVPLDNAGIRKFILANTAIEADNLDLVLFQLPNPEAGLTRESFLHILRENPAADSDMISHFLSLSQSGESLAAEECRSGLLLFAQQKLGARNLSDDLWDRILNTVMIDADVNVLMEQWFVFCKRTARIVRLVKYVKR
eukprot:gnl/TRDRNA2_/TRDRNA2_201032_c0_seq1.p1 gnl/TRDRNA2_/TRDRNA2_201032_c0~~gnl/TRDRNA2_/TRDRNA2_201032_c0_seq1.p1  ORF type:complete len:260 (+),score=48.79 gnl/TRDRNA2_/TRDRNA2_201032_c0_seq1:115-894(+)